MTADIVFTLAWTAAVVILFGLIAFFASDIDVARTSAARAAVNPDRSVRDWEMNFEHFNPALRAGGPVNPEREKAGAEALSVHNQTETNPTCSATRGTMAMSWTCRRCLTWWVCDNPSDQWRPCWSELRQRYIVPPGGAIERLERYVKGLWPGYNPGETLRSPNCFDDLRQLFIVVTGLGGETGELLEHFKKQVRNYAGVVNPLDRAAIVLEFGDVLHYLTQLANMHGITMAEIVDANIRKLNARHGRKEEA
jgi:NTP pyrophosphatase (non-canonical NTP hydrolase)